MDFIIRNYEKWILAVCLILLLFSLHIVSRSQQSVIQETRKVKAEVGTLLKSDNLIEELDADKMDQLDTMLNAPETQLNLMVSPNPNGARRAGLLDGTKFIICKNKSCGYVLPYTTEVCPWCNTQQEPIGPEGDLNADLDKDGIPDAFEKATTYLHYRYKDDAMNDFDGDGFLNIEEYRAGTDMMDAESIPPLAYLLRVENASQNEVPVTLKRIKNSGSEESKDWKAVLSVEGESRPRDIKLNGDIPKMAGYKLVSFGSEQKDVVISNGSTSYTLEVGAPKLKQSSYSISLRYLGNHIFRGYQKKTDITALLKEAVPEKLNLKEKREKMKQLQMQMMQRGGMNGMNGMQGAGDMTGMNGMAGMNANGMNGMNSALDFQLVFDVNVGEIFALTKLPADANGAVTSMGGSAGMGRGGRMNDGMGMGMGGNGTMTGYEEEIEPIVEYYQMLDIVPPTEENGNIIIRVQPLADALGTPKGNPIMVEHMDTIPYYNPMATPDDAPNHDFIPATSGMNGNGMGGGMQGMQGMNDGMQGMQGGFPR